MGSRQCCGDRESLLEFPSGRYDVILVEGCWSFRRTASDALLFRLVNHMQTQGLILTSRRSQTASLMELRGEMLLESRPIEEIVLVLFVCLQYCSAERNHSFSTLSRCRDLHFRDTLRYSAADPKSSDRPLSSVPMITVGYIGRAMQQSVEKCYC
jgi:hypothetical protein